MQSFTFSSSSWCTSPHFSPLLLPLLLRFSSPPKPIFFWTPCLTFLRWPSYLSRPTRQASPSWWHHCQLMCRSSTCLPNDTLLTAYVCFPSPSLSLSLSLTADLRWILLITQPLSPLFSFWWNLWWYTWPWPLQRLLVCVCMYTCFSWVCTFVAPMKWLQTTSISWFMVRVCTCPHAKGFIWKCACVCPYI